MTKGAVTLEGSVLHCEECGAPMRRADGLDGETFSTLVGYGLGACGHPHDDNCQGRIYVCRNGHKRKVSVQRSCAHCDWRGKMECFCHPGKKLTTWPKDDPEVSRKPFPGFNR